MIWFFVWFILATVILVISFWTFTILLRQKKAWSAFAGRHKLKVINNGLLKSIAIEGLFKGNHISIFSERQVMPDGRGQQYRSIIQFQLPPNMPTEGVIASRYFTPFVNNLGLPKKWHLPAGGWKEEPLARAGVAARVKGFLTPERIKAIETLASFSRAHFVYIFDEQEGYVRVESADPLDDTSRMDKLIHKIHQIAQVLSVQESEIEGFNELAGREESIDPEDIIYEEVADISADLGVDLQSEEK